MMRLKVSHDGVSFHLARMRPSQTLNTMKMLQLRSYSGKPYRPP